MTVSDRTLKDAIVEAERFIKRAKAAIVEAERVIKRAKAAREDIRKYTQDVDDGIEYPYYSNMYSAAAKRSSMDLTRSLAELRRPHQYT